MAEMTVEKLHAIIGALYATIAVHEQTITEQSALITQLRGESQSLLSQVDSLKPDAPSLLE